MNPQAYSSLSHVLKRIALATVLALMFLSLSSKQMASSQDPQPSQEQQPEIELVPPGQEKRLHVGVRADIPLKFKVKNLNSKRWAHDLEIEVENTSEKPIYFFHFYLVLSRIKSFTGGRYAFWLHYGRGKLLDFATPIETEDIPLLPGEKYVFKISKGDAKGWDHMREKEGRPEPKLLEIEFQSINFGDGTGYDLSGPRDTRKKINFYRTCVPPPNLPPGLSTLLSASLFIGKVPGR